MKAHFVWLGAKRAAKRGVGAKGALLDQATRAKLPVPAGGILLHEFYEALLENEILVWQNGRCHIPHPPDLYASLYSAARFPQLDKPIAVRAAFTAPRSTASAQLDVNPQDAVVLTTALCQVWSLIPADAPQRRDVLLMEMVTAQHSGWAQTAVSASDTAQVETQDFASLLPHLGKWQRPDAALPPYAQRLQQLLRGLRRTFGAQAWRVVWADDGRICWLLQLTPNP